MSGQAVTVYVTKYALSAGIYEMRGRITDDGKYFVASGPMRVFARIGRDAFADAAAAKADALARIEKRKILLARQAKDLASERFSMRATTIEPKP